MLKEKWFLEDWYKSGIGAAFKVRKKLFSKKSAFQKIEVFDLVNPIAARLAVFDDCVMFTRGYHHFYHEMLAHVALTPMTRTTNVLIVGGGDCGVLHEVLKHPKVTSVDQVDIDPLVTKISGRFFPELCASNQDPRARIYFGDGIEWVNSQSNEWYDVIIVDSTDPIDMAKALFEMPFYKDCHRILADGGLLVTQSGSPLLHRDHIKTVRGLLRMADFWDVATYSFPQPDYPGGTWSATVAIKRGEIRRALAANLYIPETKYYSRGVHETALFFDPFR